MILNIRCTRRVINQITACKMGNMTVIVSNLLPRLVVILGPRSGRVYTINDSVAYNGVVGLGCILCGFLLLNISNTLFLTNICRRTSFFFTSIVLYLIKIGTTRTRCRINKREWRPCCQFRGSKSATSSTKSTRNSTFNLFRDRTLERRLTRGWNRVERGWNSSRRKRTIRRFP